MTARTMPVLFVGHGSPMNTIEHNAWSDAWRLVGAALPRPRAILCVSAHWETAGPQVTGSASPATIHDFYGFPQALFDVRYPAPGDPALARRVVELLGAEAGIDPERGLDHGVWSVLVPMFPEADIPVVQLGIDTRRDGAWHYAVARRLGALRDEGVLILCSGNIVHNLRLYDPRAAGGAAWAVRFRDQVNALLRDGNHRALMDWPSLTDAQQAIPTPEHYIPLLYALANGRAGDKVTVFNDDVASTLSMTSLLIDVA
ncbi:4,5-DOPA dioxygenase extradiol [Lysobacter sp. M15]|uniref:4,5-DOPA-extradiol-dioxygenase n=1 Tax=Lysobacter sp. M15 TaxID=2916837 RepID=UPI001F59D431|nr:4,5-DOPA dioxygenase extradiol [Lysobacter sp. M15]